MRGDGVVAVVFRAMQTMIKSVQYAHQKIIKC